MEKVRSKTETQRDRQPDILTLRWNRVCSQSHMVDPRLQVSELHFDKFSTPFSFSCWEIRFKTQVSTCSGYPSDAELWSTKVEILDPVEDLRNS